MDFGNRNARCDRRRIPSTRQSRERGLAHGHSVRCLAFDCGVFFGNNRRHRGDPLDFHGAFCAFSGVLRPITVSVKLANPKEDRSAEAKQRCGSKESCSCAKLRRISREQRHSPTLHGTIQRWSSFQNPGQIVEGIQPSFLGCLDQARWPGCPAGYWQTGSSCGQSQRA